MKKWLIVLAVMFIGLIASMNTGCKGAKYDITGAWRVDYILAAPGNFDVAFTGSLTSGYTIWDNQAAGEYTVADQDVEFVLRIYVTVSGTTRVVIYHFVGTFENKDRMSGTVKAYDPDVQGSEVNGTWLAQKM
jgi:hypothetical protein